MCDDCTQVTSHRYMHTAQPTILSIIGKEFECTKSLYSPDRAQAFADAHQYGRHHQQVQVIQRSCPPLSNPEGKLCEVRRKEGFEHRERRITSQHEATTPLTISVPALYSTTTASNAASGATDLCHACWTVADDDNQAEATIPSKPIIPGGCTEATLLPLLGLSTTGLNRAEQAQAF